jgi:hypothetical protein
VNVAIWLWADVVVNSSCEVDKQYNDGGKITYLEEKVRF